jgi:hypothetical protein
MRVYGFNQNILFQTWSQIEKLPHCECMFTFQWLFPNFLQYWEMFHNGIF